MCFNVPVKRDLMALVRAQAKALDFKRELDLARCHLPVGYNITVGAKRFRHVEVLSLPMTYELQDGTIITVGAKRFRYTVSVECMTAQLCWFEEGVIICLLNC